MAVVLIIGAMIAVAIVVAMTIVARRDREPSDFMAYEMKRMPVNVLIPRSGIAGSPAIAESVPMRVSPDRRLAALAKDYREADEQLFKARVLLRAEAFAAMADGMAPSEVAKATGMAMTTVKRWRQPVLDATAGVLVDAEGASHGSAL
jgi:hypothetical protein